MAGSTSVIGRGERSTTACSASSRSRRRPSTYVATVDLGREQVRADERDREEDVDEHECVGRVAAGREGDVRISTFNGTPFVLEMIQDGDIVAMDIGESLDWIAHATIDGYLRALCGLPVPKDIGVPFYIFDAGNVKDAGVPAQFDQGYGKDYVAGYRKLWGLAK